MAFRRFTSRSQDAAFLESVFQRQSVQWTVGDACFDYKMRSVTTLERLEERGPGDTICHLANGEAMHISKMRRVS